MPPAEQSDLFKRVILFFRQFVLISKDGGDGQVSCWGAFAVRGGGDGGDDRSHERRGFSEHGGAGWGGGVEQAHRAACDEVGIYGEQAVFVGYDGSGGTDMPSDGGWASAEDQRGAGRDRKANQEGKGKMDVGPRIFSAAKRERARSEAAIATIKCVKYNFNKPRAK